jgi:TPP-dependent pyruvate/acetoin dehydrogenase alpha subunit
MARLPKKDTVKEEKEVFILEIRNIISVAMISHLGPQLAIADGVALAHKLRKENKVSLAFTGEGGTSEGDFHEALNVGRSLGSASDLYY